MYGSKFHRRQENLSAGRVALVNPSPRVIAPPRMTRPQQPRTIISSPRIVSGYTGGSIDPGSTDIENLPTPSAPRFTPTKPPAPSEPVTKKGTNKINIFGYSLTPLQAGLGGLGTAFVLYQGYKYINK